MTLRLRPWIGFLVALLTSGGSFAQSIVLQEDLHAGDCFRYELSLQVEGKMKIERDGKIEALPLRASANHAFIERGEARDAQGGIRKAVRLYSLARSESTVGTERGRNELAADRRLIVVASSDSDSTSYSPTGPLSRDELDLVAEHFDTLSLTTLLPQRDVKPGDTWTISDATVQQLCLFDGLVNAKLIGKLDGMNAEVATISVSGTAEGVENGARVKLSIESRLTFDVTNHRITGLRWEQTDTRDQGPVSPATEVKAVVTLHRTRLAEEPKELTDAAKTVGLTKEPIPDSHTRLRFADPSGRYQLLYPRSWHIVGRTADHLVLRLLEKGEFLGQATITTWKKEAPGKQTRADDFKATINRMPGWEAEKILADGPQTIDAGRRLYRVVATGKQDGVPVVQSFLLLTGENGEQMVVTVLTTPEKFEKLASRDLLLTTGITFPSVK